MEKTNPPAAETPKGATVEGPKRKIQQFEFGLGYQRHTCCVCDTDEPGLYFMARSCGGLYCLRCMREHANTCPACRAQYVSDL